MGITLGKTSRDREQEFIAALAKPDGGEEIGIMMVINSDPGVFSYVLAGYASLEDGIKIWQESFNEAFERAKNSPEALKILLEETAKNPVRLVSISIEEIQSISPTPRKPKPCPNPEFVISMLTDKAKEFWNAGTEVKFDIPSSTTVN